MFARLTGALMLTLALLAVAPAFAAAALTPDAQRVYDDYRSDGAIEPCAHTAKTYRATLAQVTPDIEEETPAFRPAVEAALEERDAKPCKAEATPTPTPAKGSTSGGSGSAPSASGGAASAAPASGSSTGSAPAPGVVPGASGAAPSTSAPATTDPGSPAAPAQPPAAAPAAPAVGVAATDPVLLDRPHSGTPTGLLIAAALLGLALLATLAALAARRFGWAEERLAPTRHAWGEAAYRTSATWGDFVDWMRLGH